MDERPSPHALGRNGEEAAADYLARAGFRITATGYRRLRGEIDIIARDGPTLVFVEVKTRRAEEFGFPEEAVTPAKQRQIRRIAEAFLMDEGLIESRTPCRFDVLSLVPEGGGFRIRHIRNAF
jgi:putative endonuclease